MLDTINVGTVPNDRTGDPFRTAALKTNAAISLLNGKDHATVSTVGGALSVGLNVVDLTGGSVVMQMPSSPSPDDTVEVVPVNLGNAANPTVTLMVATATLLVTGAPVRFTYVSATYGWVRRA